MRGGRADWRTRALRVVGTAFAVIGMIVVFVILMASSLAWVVLHRTPADIWLWLAGSK